jgi:NADPH2:quinone reductase
MPRAYGPNEILIKVEVAGSNPKDWKHPAPNYFHSKINQGDDCAGTVAGIGDGVHGFNVGDRVAGFHQMKTDRGTYAEYSVCAAHTVFHIPTQMSYEEAATIPLAGKSSKQLVCSANKSSIHCCGGSVSEPQPSIPICKTR